MANNLITTGVTQYVGEIKDLLLGEALYTDSYEEFNKIYDVKGPEKLMVAKDEAFISEASCVFAPSGDTVISQRVIDVKHYNSDFAWCRESWLKSAIGMESTEAFPELRKLLDNKMRSLNKAIENQIWSDIATIATSDVPSGNTYTAPTGTTYIGLVDKAISLLPEAVRSNGNAKVYLSPVMFDELQREIRDKNYFHYVGEGKNEFTYPGSSVKIHKAQGLVGSSKIYALDPSNVYIGTYTRKDEMPNINTELTLKGTLNGSAEWFYGLQIAFPDEVAVVTKQ